MEDTSNNGENQIEEPITKKDPKRVEQGKRLAAISKEVKERKMREKIMQEMESKKWGKKYYWYAFGGISLIGLIYLLTRKSEKVKYYPTVYEERKSPKKKREPKNFEEFD